MSYHAEVGVFKNLHKIFSGERNTGSVCAKATGLISLPNYSFNGGFSDLARNVNGGYAKTIIDSSYANCNDSWFFFGTQCAEND